MSKTPAVGDKCWIVRVDIPAHDKWPAASRFWRVPFFSEEEAEQAVQNFERAPRTPSSHTHVIRTARVRKVEMLGGVACVTDVQLD